MKPSLRKIQREGACQSDDTRNYHELWLLASEEAEAVDEATKAKTELPIAPTLAQFRAICHACPVRQECLDWATTAQEYGVWGGTTEHERRRLTADPATRVTRAEMKDSGELPYITARQTWKNYGG